MSDGYTFRKDGEGYEVAHGGDVIGRVERQETSNTGFRHGRCVGQVAVLRWFAWLPNGHHPPAPGYWMYNGHGTRAAAADALRDARVPLNPERPRV